MLRNYTADPAHDPHGGRIHTVEHFQTRSRWHGLPRINTKIRIPKLKSYLIFDRPDMFRRQTDF